MKLTAKQHRNIANGIDRIRLNVVLAFASLYSASNFNHACQSKDLETGTCFSDRFKK